ncbi:bactericidal permeability-increasing protein [Ophiocordyceps camponoti-floridani]|uniref:Bactericidal permeability-increasing protein n=1 Tax=Ophiocordyceps camponoti-floridani TaxID=2030778 RepID=A0A8H4VEL4_9HYPO|nr:bactericidal permeability-increasing protein [Ophiocordyceps camponoti-floridani]
MFSCFSCGNSRRRRSPDTEPLLPQYNDETPRQTRVHEKLHTYQMVRALGNGYMPSNEQLIVQLRCLLAAEALNPHELGLSVDGRALIRSVKLWLAQLVELLRVKNSGDEVQDFVWNIVRAGSNIDVGHLGAAAAASKARADASATVASLRTVGSLLLSNSDFRLFLADLGAVGRHVFRDSALTLSDVARKAGHEVAHDKTDEQEAPSTSDLGSQAKEVAHVVSSSAAEVAAEASHSLAEHMDDGERRALLTRLKQVVTGLRRRTDYSSAASTLARLLQRYVVAYSRLATDTARAVDHDVGVTTGGEVDDAARNFWRLVTSFGSREAWDEVEESFKRVVETGRSEPGLDELMEDLGRAVEDMLLQPAFFDEADERLARLKERARAMTSKSSVAEAVENVLHKLDAALRSTAQDESVSKLVRSSARIAHVFSPEGQYINGDLVSDAIDVFAPLLIKAVQFVPIPRLEVTTPDMFLLLENLVLQPGRTVNRTSFLPYKLQVSTQNDVEVRKDDDGRTRSAVSSLVRIRLNGLSLAADDVGYWFRLRGGLLNGLQDSGLVSMHLDERGVDIALDVEIGRDRMDQLLTLQRVRVKIHRLDYTLHQSNLTCLAWILKPILRPLLRHALESRIATAADESLRFLNRELLYARERLRATRVADPASLWTFARAVAARLTPGPTPDLDVRAGARPGRQGPFRGRYAPGSIVRLWEEEGAVAEQRVFEAERGGWRNDVFDVKTGPVVGG